MYEVTKLTDLKIISESSIQHAEFFLGAFAEVLQLLEQSVNGTIDPSEIIERVDGYRSGMVSFELSLYDVQEAAENINKHGEANVILEQLNFSETEKLITFELVD